MKQRKFFRVSLLILIGVILSIGLTTAAKYVTDTITSYFLRSKNFYFSSNLLDTSNPTYRIGTWSGVGNFDISFDLLSKDNEYLYSESDITFTISVTCSQDVTCTSNMNSGTLYSTDADHKEGIVITVVPSRVFVEDESVTIQITARSTSPYIKEVKATFTYIVGREGVSYEIEDEANRPYLLLKIINDIDYCTVTTAFGNYTVGAHISDSAYRSLIPENQAKCISQYIDISFNPQNFLLDNTSSIIERSTYTTTPISGINYINTLRFAISPNSTIAIKFYKNNPTIDNTYPIVNNTSVISVIASDPV